VKILILGANGMLGHRTASLLSERHEVVGTLRSPDATAEAFAPRARFVTGVSVEDPGALAGLIASLRPDAVVNCIGIVKQRPEAHQSVPSIRTNALFPHEVAALCSGAGARFVHLSTDCVFSGDCGSYTESDVPDADDLYGRSKLLGEVTDVPGAVTVRTSMVGWEVRRPTGLLEWFASRRGAACDGYARSVFSGLATRDLADVIEGLCTRWRDVDGLWHVSAEPISKLDLLTQLRDELGWDIQITPRDEPVIDRSLDSNRFRTRTGWTPRPWPDAVARLAAERALYEAVGEDHPVS
jgi:dTDP-4-dehydrorhamnose reductase